MIEERLHLRADELWPLDERATLRRQPPDAPIDVVAPRIPEADLAVLDDRVVPVGDVDRAVGADLDVDGPERDVTRTQHVGHALRRVPGAVVRDHEAHDAVCAEVVGDEAPLPAVGQMAPVDDLVRAVLRLAAVQPAENRRLRLRRDEGRAGKEVEHSLAVGAVGPEVLAPVVESVPPAVDHAVDEDPELERVGSKLPDTARVQPPHAVWSLDVTVDVDRLIEVKEAVVSPAKGVEDVVRVLGAEAGEHDAAPVGLAVAVGVREVEQLGGVRDVGTSIAGLDAGRHEEPVGEDRRPVRAAVAVLVLEHDDAILRHLTGLDMRVQGRRRHP